jgi:natural product biosynthesis luciferase-like monooxygenase protein
LHAAVARETKHVRLRAGSVVLPLHNPIRVAEEWAMVDNLSGGRVELSFASGWHPDDFVLAPQKYKDRHTEMLHAIRTVQELWRGKAISGTSGSGLNVEVKTFPRPLQEEVPIWITAAGNPETFARAGELGANLLTHLLDQDFETLAEKIAIYRRSRKQNGHDPETGRVSVMLHTFIGDDLETVREQVRRPYCDYLKTIFFLLKGLSYSRGRQLDLATISEEERDEAITALFERFFSKRALLGTKDSCRHLIEQLLAIGVNDISCLLDFGVDSDLVLASLPRLAELKDECRQAPSALSPVTEEVSVKMDEVFLKNIQANCPQTVSGAEFYRIMAEHGLHEGPRFQCIQQIWRRDHEALAELTMPQVIEDEAGAFEFHPAFLNACFQSLLACLPRMGLMDGRRSLWVPVGLASFKLYQNSTDLRHCWSHAQLEAESMAGDSCKGNIHIFNDEGNLVAEAHDIKLRRLEGETEPPADSMQGLTYELQWQQVGSISKASPPTAQDSWIIFADRKGYGHKLATLLEHDGHRCFLAAYQKDPDAAPTSYSVDPLDRQAIGSLLASIRNQWEAPLRGIVHLWSLDAGDDETASSSGHGQVLASESALQLIQALAEFNMAPQPRVWFITQGAQTAGAKTGRVAVNQSPLWGLGRTCSLELPDLWGGLVDLDPDETAEDVAGQLRDVLYQQGEEDQIAIRQGEYLAARLVPRLMAGKSVVIRPDGSYLITGGLDGVGFEVARWLVNKGARHITLLGRRKLPPKESWSGLKTDGEWQKYLANLKSLEAAGAQVEYFPVDVADESEMDQFFAGFRSAHRPPIRGVVHAASVWESQEGKSLVGALLRLDIPAVRQVMRPKVTGSVLLARHLAQADYDFMVFFSSAASMCGSAAQGNYAAAGAFLDAFAQNLRAQGKPVTSINWGPISGTGFGASSKGLKVHGYWESQGIYRITVEQVLEALDRILSEESPQVGVMKIDWIVLGDAFPQIARMPWAQKVYERHGKNVAPVFGSQLALELVSKGETERQRILETYLYELIAKSLRLPAMTLKVDQSLADLGLDSLIALEMRNRIRKEVGVNIPIVKFLYGPSIAQLAAYLSEQIGEPNRNRHVSCGNDRRAAGLIEDGKVREQVERLSDQQVDALLNELMASRKGRA